MGRKIRRAPSERQAPPLDWGKIGIRKPQRVQQAEDDEPRRRIRRRERRR